MGYLLLILGVLLFMGAHWFKRLAPERRAAMGDAGRGVVTVGLLAGIVLMVIGYRNAGFVNVWFPPAFMVHITNLLMVFAFWFFALSAVEGVISSKVRHKQLTAAKIWAVAHLLVNGDLASIILFGGMLAWAVGSVILINRAEPTWERPANPSWKNDGKAFVIGLVVMVVVAFIHTWLGVYPFPA
ncbi:MAG: NnrU family protein [Pseudomonadota bacterium]